MARSNIEIPDPGVTRSLNPSQTSQKFMVPGIACIHIYIYIYIYIYAYEVETCGRPCNCFQNPLPVWQQHADDRTEVLEVIAYHSRGKYWG